MRYLIAALLLMLVASGAEAAKSKTEVAARCLSQKEAQAAWPGAKHRYRRVDGKNCWYAPGKVIPAKGQALVPLPGPRPAAAMARALEPETVMVRPDVAVVAPDDTAAAAAALCGGACPRFDLDEPVYRALCGGPCPDFRAQARIDATFAALAEAQGIPGYLVSRHDSTVGQAFETEDWQDE